MVTKREFSRIVKGPLEQLYRSLMSRLVLQSQRFIHLKDVVAKHKMIPSSLYGSSPSSTSDSKPSSLYPFTVSESPNPPSHPSSLPESPSQPTQQTTLSINPPSQPQPGSPPSSFSSTSVTFLTEDAVIRLPQALNLIAHREALSQQAPCKLLFFPFQMLCGCLKCCLPLCILQ